MVVPIERWQDEQDAEQRRKDAMKLGDEERETILQVIIMIIVIGVIIVIIVIIMIIMVILIMKIMKILHTGYDNLKYKGRYFCRQVQLF